MAIITFQDRFTYANPALAAALPGLDGMTNDQLAALSPALDAMAKMVRRHSILLRSTRTAEIYRVITEHCDPRIALRLLAAKDKNGLPIFTGEAQAKQAMFGPPSPTSSQYENPALNVFVDGIRRVSAALAASWLVGQLAQIEEQRKHGELLEKQALADLDFLIKQYEQEVRGTLPERELESESYAFYFEDKTLELEDSLTVEVYMPGITTTAWTTVGTYSGVVKTAQLVLAVCDAVNTMTLTAGEGNILASPVLGEGEQLHKITVSARRRDLAVMHELISIRFRYLTDPLRELPFRWGVDPNRLRTETVNSTILRVERGLVQSVPAAGMEGSRYPTVLYFQRGPLNGAGQPVDAFGQVIPQTKWAAQGKVVFRVSPTMPEPVTVPINRLTDSDPTIQAQLDAHRYSQVALAILNEMYRYRTSEPVPIRALGALIRNDDPQQVSPCAALELVAYTVNQNETWMILDLLEIPADIQMAVGDVRGPITPFSNKPRSVRVEAQFLRSAGAALPTPSGVNPNSYPVVLQRPRSTLVEELHTRMREFYGDP